MTDRVLKVAIPVPLHRVYDYLPPTDTFFAALQPGMRVSVPFGRSKKTGVIIATDEKSSVDPKRLKRVLAVIDDEPCVDAGLLALLQWASSYYRHPLGEVISSALPKKIREGQSLIAVERAWRLTSATPTDALNQLRRAPRQAELVEAFQSNATKVLNKDSLAQLPFDSGAALRALCKRGWVEQIQQQLTQREAPVVDNEPTADPSITLNSDQSTAVNTLLDCTSFKCWLLYGVTGSGKTEVYFHKIEHTLNTGKQCLVLVPEISLTPQLLNRFERRFGARIVVMHSGLTDAERLNNWRAIRSGSAKIIIGTRSAVFVTLPKLGLIVIDEEHDSSLKQQEGFRYSARDLAIVRAQRLDIPIILGSATPSLETLRNVTEGRYSLLTLPQRAGGAEEPVVTLVDLRIEPSHQGLSTLAMSKTAEHLSRGAQVLFFLNRRGYAPAWYCNGCGWMADCTHCDAHLTYHQHSNSLQCHHCGRREAPRDVCPKCESDVKPVGQGTERIEQYLQQQFPDYPIGRMDRDVVRNKKDLENYIERAKNGDIKILIGTQMLAKGHHFPNVGLVVILNADQGLFGIDFRSTERLAQTIVQVSGRAGRAERVGEVLIQTSYPEHPLLQTLINDGYAEFSSAALVEREHAQWPPYSHLALVRAYSNEINKTMSFLTAAKHHVQALANAHNVKLFGPVVAPMARRAGKHHGQLLSQCKSRKGLSEVLHALSVYLSEQPPLTGVRWSLDVDPQELF